MKKALVIGASGFVGEHLLEFLRSTREYDVHATKPKGRTIACPGVEADDLDLLDAGAVAAALKRIRPDRIYHLADESSVAQSWNDPVQAYDVNVKGALHVLEAVRALPYPPRLMLVGSGEEYGRIRPDEGPVAETHAAIPENPYAAAKLGQNMMGRIYAEAYRMDILMVRTFNYYGPGQPNVFVASDLCRQVAQMEKGLRPPVLKVGNLTALRDFTDVRDVVRAYWMLMVHGKSGETYNVGSGQAVAVQDVLDLILSLTEVKPRVETDKGRLRPVDMPVIAADARKLVAATGWAPRFTMEQTVRDILADWRAKV